MKIYHLANCGTCKRILAEIPKLKRFELLEHFGPDVFHPTVGAAVDDYLADHAVNWTP